MQGTGDRVVALDSTQGVCVVLSASCLCAQVLEWTQTVLAAGEAFSGSESATLCDTLQRQSGRFFAAYHAANMQARAPREPVPSQITHCSTHHGFAVLHSVWEFCGLTMLVSSKGLLYPGLTRCLLSLNKSHRSPPKCGREKQHSLLVSTILLSPEASC